MYMINAGVFLQGSGCWLQDVVHAVWEGRCSLSVAALQKKKVVAGDDSLECATVLTAALDVAPIASRLTVLRTPVGVCGCIRVEL